ncbi:MAG: ParB/RepB/Spo0J family partition protein [Thermoplasmata archaeon]|nr:ParB/RepB/Spo0J family partition protein [Candidatus Sysuiplasma jiujiangense]
MTDRVSGVRRQIAIPDLIISESNVRMGDIERDQHEVDKLAKSISETGLQNPLRVREIPGQPGQYEVYEGSRRLRALKQLGKSHADCIVSNVSDAEATLASLHENLVRGEISALEISKGIYKIMEQIEGGDITKRREVARRLNWFKDDGRPDTNRVTKTLKLGEFQEKLGGKVAVKYRTKGDAMRKEKVIPWAVAERLQTILENPVVESQLQSLKVPERQKDYEDYVMRLANAYRQVRTGRRKVFEERFIANANQDPVETAQEVERESIKSQLVTFRLDPELYGWIVQFAAKNNVTKTEAIIRIIQAHRAHLSSSGRQDQINDTKMTVEGQTL